MDNGDAGTGETRRRRRKIILKAAVGTVLAISAASFVWWWSQPVYPGVLWVWQTPEEAGFSKAKLDVFAQKARGDGCIVQGGKMIYGWGQVDRPNDVASLAKPIYAYLTFKAIETGRIPSLDSHLIHWAHEIKDLNPTLGYPDRDITFRHLLEQTSGYGLEERPGEAFAYNDYATGLLVWTLFHRVYGLQPAQYDDLLNGPLLGAALGFEDRATANYRNLNRGHVRRGRIRISARDLARFGLLYLRGGVWRGRRVLRQDLFAEALAPGETLPMDFPQTSGVEAEELPEPWQPLGGGKDEKGHAGCLGRFWWHNHITVDGTRFLPDAPPGTFMGSGYGGQMAMVVMPELDLIAVWFDAYEWTGQKWSPLDEVGRFKVNEMIRELLAARTTPPR